MKKILCAILIVTLVLAFPSYASELTAQATVTFTCDDYFYVEIPDTIVVGEVCTINAPEVNIAPNKCVYVDLMNNPDEYVRLYNEADETQTIDAYFMDGEGNVLTITDMNLATFQYGSSGASQTFSTFVNDVTGKAAGQYTGIANFYIHCD